MIWSHNDRRGLETAVATRCVAGAMMVSDDVASKRRSSLGMEISLAAALPNLTWRDRNIISTCDEHFRFDADSVEDRCSMRSAWGPLAAVLLPQQEHQNSHMY